MQCGAQGCEEMATEALRFKSMQGHVHVCSRDAAINREWADVIASKQITSATCPYPCSDDPIYVKTPTQL